MLEEVKNILGANYIEDTDEVILDLIITMKSIASDASNRSYDDSKLKPYVIKAVISEYLARGAEGLASRSEGSISSSYNDIEAKLRKDVQSIRWLK